MATKDEVIAELEDIYNSVKRAEINHKKAPKDRLTLSYAKVRTQCIDSYWKSFKLAHTTLLKITTKQERASLLYFTDNYYDLCEEKYLELKTIMEDLIESKSAPCQTDIPTRSSAVENKISADVKLPRIDLPKFSGNYEEWQTFQDIFMSIIHNNKSLSDVQRLQYLKSCLSGEASTTLKFYKVIESNYQPAWDALKERYNHKRLITNSILKRLFTTKKVLSQSPSQLKSFIDNTKECLNGLCDLEVSTSSWDSVIIFMAMQRLDTECHKQWEDYVSKECGKDLPKLDNLYKFMEDKIHTLELTSPSSSSRQPFKERSFHATTSSEKTCIFCQEVHALCHCKKFGKLSPGERSEFVKTQRLCYNCLLPGHSVYLCKQKVSCKVCHRRHHTLLHQHWNKETSAQYGNGQTTDVSAHTNVEEDDQERQHQGDEQNCDLNISANFAARASTALLATALVPIRDMSGHVTVLRALVDQGSQATFISERATQIFKVKRSAVKGNITGVGGTKTTVNHAVHLEVLSRYEEDFNLKVKMYVMPTRLTSLLPSKSIQVNETISNTWPHLQGLVLADPHFNRPGRIDLLLGVEVCAQILKNEIIRGPPGTPCAQSTNLGWILFGSVYEQTSQEDFITMHHHVDLDNMLKNMWELEAPHKRVHTAEERLCEEIYEATHSRTDDGRYVVKLPLKSNQPVSAQGDTRKIALTRLIQMEKRLERKPDLKDKYARAIAEYIEKNHMEEVPEEEMNKPAVYLPHHAVIRDDKETTKVRIVFDASCKGTNNKSLNDDLLVGPQLQEDLRNIIMRWRMKRVCIVADIRQMYLQILVTKTDADYQRLLWRNDINNEVKDYRLLRVTFGTASAPYLAVKTLQQIAEDEGKFDPIAQQIIKEDFYMDDLMTGSDTAENAIKLARNIQTILRKGGFILQKWSSNSVEFLKEIDPIQRSSHVKMDINLHGTMKALGLSWNMGEDTFEYSLTLPAVPETTTKRTILAQVQRLFDPLGWLAPAIVPAKILMQSLWLQGKGWDEALDSETKQEWINIQQTFQHLSNVKVQRWLNTLQNEQQDVTIHGFCDASIKAYAAVAYLRVRNKDGEIHTSIIAAKTRVAPVKPVSLPRLELCGAVLLSRLLKQVGEAMRIPTDQIYAWTDSSVVLSWLYGNPGRWTVFVSNRVVEILDNTGNQRWFHVASEDNPADVASRGTSLSNLIPHQLWWSGPRWLQTDDISYRRPEIKQTELERKKTIQVNLNIENEGNEIKFENFDTLHELLKAIVYCRRFLNSKKQPNIIEKELTTDDLEDALIRCVRIAQRKEFEDEIEMLSKHKYVKKDSQLKLLNPYLDERNVLRVGGRLRNSNLDEQRKHPIILGTKNELTPLLLADAHKKTLHGGIQLMICYLRSKYWIIRIKNAVKSQINKCIVCARYKAASRTQIMGDLPKVRTSEARPFLHSGVDFAGPLQVLMSRGRGAKSNKAYIAIFICMAVKCVHLELVGDLTSESFVGAFHRFVARRGRCTHLWSDQGRNFVGANKELSAAWEEAKLQLPGHLKDILAREGTQWHHIPSYSPNFGGLWEAGVKSIKFHLKRVLSASLTFEEMTTTLCEIEACLNSRPLSPIDTSDTDVIDPLTPGHFLIGEAPVTIPSPDLRTININRLSRWQFTQKLVRDFWHRWQDEYLSRLQERPKWLKRQKEFAIGDIVLIKDDQLPPGKWSLGRIVAKHAGNDDVTRVYSVKCRGSVTKRSVSKLCEFLISDNNNN